MRHKRLTLLSGLIFAVILPALTVLALDPEPAAKEDAEPSAAAIAEPAPEQKDSGKRIAGVEVRGNQIVSTNTILSKIQTREGSLLVQETVNEDLKRLYATGFFQDIKIEVEEEADGGSKLVIEVLEKPIIREISIEGEQSFKEDKLRKEFKVLEGQILDQKAVKQGVEAIQKLYRDKGFRFVTVDSRVKMQQGGKEAKVIVEIAEGEKYKIRDLKFDGAVSFKSKKLIRLMRTRKRNMWTFRSGVFKQELFEKDLERIQLFYQQEGYLDVKVAPSFDYDKDKKGIHITILIEEGQHYVTGDIKIEGNRLFPESEIWQELEMLPGLTYSQFYLSKDLEKIRDYYHHRGYMDARIIPDTNLNKATGKVDVVYKIQEGDLYFVEKVVVRGNTKTKDIVIRRELRIRPGEKFDGDKIAKSKQRLDNLGFFEEVTYDTEPSSAPNRRDLIFRVKEKRTGELSFGGGVSSIDRYVGFAEIAQRNFDILNWPRFTGAGQSLSLKARIGSITKDFSLSFVEPYLFNKPISWGNDVYMTSRDSRNTDFDEERRGASTTFSRLFKDVVRVGTGYTLERVELDELSDDAPATVRLFEGANWLSRLKLFSSFDNRDNVFNPTKGTLITGSGELIGSFLGGDQDYYILQTSVTHFWTFFSKHVLEASVRLATSQEFGDSPEVPVFDRFYAGGLGSVRGFNYRRVGPIEAGDAVGGQTLAVLNLEYTFPILKLDAFRGAVFVDVGQVDPEAYKIGFGDFSVSTGPGIKVKTPLGPFALYYGLPIANKDTEDRNGRIEFSLSRGF